MAAVLLAKNMAEQEMEYIFENMWRVCVNVTIR
jgi:hypothetical protein